MSTETKTDINAVLKDFTGSGERNAPDFPFVVGNYEYATDSHAIVRIPCDGRPQTKCDAIPPVSDLPWYRPSAQSVDLPDVGDGMMECESCGGEKVLGGFECEDCDGAGKYGDPTAVPIGPLYLQRRQIARLRRNGIVTVFPMTVSVGTSGRYRRKANLPGVWFEGDGFQGILMGTNPEAPGTK